MAIVQYYVACKKDEDPASVTENLRCELSDDHNFSADDDDFEFCIETCAEDFHDRCDGWERHWPLLFMLWIDGKYIGMFEVEREYEPTFSVNKVN
ncbi:hypothetical protein ACX3SL_11410 [Morganella morganii]